MSKKIQTAERVSQSDVSDNYVYQRSVLAYVEAAKRIHGKVLEIGTGSGYGVDLFGSGNFSYLENQSYGPRFDGTMRALGPPLADGSNDSSRYQAYPGHNDFWNKGIINQTDFNISNGDANSTQYFSAQHVDQTGTTPGDLYNRTNVRLNGTRKIGKTININYSTICFKFLCTRHPSIKGKSKFCQQTPKGEVQ